MNKIDNYEISKYWNNEKTTYQAACIHHLIEEQAKATPDIAAIEFRDLQLSYTELNEQANHLAHRLISEGIADNEMIGLCLERSLEMIVAVVAILKAGAAVLPLDATYPPERLNFMLTDARVSKVITSQNLLNNSPKIKELFEGLVLFDVAVETSFLSSEKTTNPITQTRPGHLAYCIYTSGSTGTPKGVLIEHAALSNLVAWHREAWLAEVGTRILLFSPISFDVAFHEIIAGLCTGGTLIQIDEETRINPMALIDFIRERNVEKCYMPFVSLQQLALAAQTQDAPDCVKELIIGGEPLRITSEIRDFATKTGCVIHNNYGSTECLTVATYTLKPPTDHWPSLAPIGKPSIYNTNVYILDPSLEPVAVGVIGEIYVDGDCLARGYHDPELTKERFIESPFCIQGKRLYKTRDLGRYMPDGNIECIGRMDHQVKIKGYRVELSEIETVLADHELVSECVVTAKRNAAGTNRLYAYVIPVKGKDVPELHDILQAHLSTVLPDYMVPRYFITLDALPLTPSGKVDTRNLPLPAQLSDKSGPEKGTALYMLENKVKQIWCDLLDIQSIDPEKSFFELGGDSLLLVQAHQKIAALVNTELPAVTLFKYPTISTLIKYLSAIERTEKTSDTSAADMSASTSIREQDIAIIGMACRIPGAENPDEFWENLREGVESITVLTEEELDKLNADSADYPNFVNAASVLSGIELFDASFFGYSPAEAETIDPQQRLFLECAWEAVENAGVNPFTHQGSIGVYAGSAMSTYLINNVLPAKMNTDVFLSHRHFHESTELRIEQGNARDHLPTRVSYKLNLRGPSMNIQSTCSTSLVAVHSACQAILNGECDVALAGGVSVITPQNTGYLWQEGMMLSPDGHCRVFDAKAGGTVFGNGMGIVVLKSLSKAIADKDHIYSVIKGSAVNNDGAVKVDYAGPNLTAQADVIAKAHEQAGVYADEISYVEAHGTGTVLGDPIEIAALEEAFGRTSRRQGKYCAIGSVKTNIGHLDEAAGVIGLIKTALALYHKELPPTLHFEEPNPQIDFETNPFSVNTALCQWNSPDNAARKAGVSSFGMGGTNCHVVLEEPPLSERKSNEEERNLHILPLSAKSPGALRANAEKYVEYLAASTEADFADICFSAATGRSHFKYRLAVTAQGRDNACTQLAQLLQDSGFDNLVSFGGESQPIAFMFTGQGSQYHDMGHSLYETQPVFRAVLEECDKIVQPLIGHSLISLLYETHSNILHDTAIAQPAIFSLEYALYKLWTSWGVRPEVLIGHSLGEYVAACVSGVFSLEDGLKLVSARGQLMQNLPQTGGMVQVMADAKYMEDMIKDFGGKVSIAAINTPEHSVISGELKAVEAICALLHEKQVDFIPLNVSHAFHSPLMASMLDEFEAFARNISYAPPQINIISNVTGELIGEDEIMDPAYWVNHIIQPVHFAKGVKSIRDMGISRFLELGPKATLINFGRLCLSEPENMWLSSLTPKDPDTAIASLKQLYLFGANINWYGFDAPFSRKRIPLPTYAFQKEKYWLEPPDNKNVSYTKNTDKQTGRLANTYQIEWEEIKLGADIAASNCHWVILGSEDEFSIRIRNKLEKQGAPYSTISVDDIDLKAWDGLSKKLTSLQDTHENLCILFLPEVTADDNIPGHALNLLNRTRRLFASIQSIQEIRNLCIVTRDANFEKAGLAQSVLTGFAHSANVEHAELNCTCASLVSDPGNADLETLIFLLNCDGTHANEEQFMIKEGGIYVPRLKTSPVSDSSENLPIRPDGTYLITGGTGGLGLRLALKISQQKPGRLVLLSRSGVVANCESEIWRKIQDTGTKVDIVNADVSDVDQLKKIIQQDLQNDITGVFHCAGLIDDGILLNQTDERFAQVLQPKVNGAWHLHHLTCELPLELFVMYSSTASLIGYGGQTSYAAANAFLDSLAHYRRARNLPALSVSWGSWSGSGMTGRMCATELDHLSQSGEQLIDIEDGLDRLGHLLNTDTVHAAIISMNWDKFAHSRDRLPSIIKSLISALSKNIQQQAVEEDITVKLQKATPAEARRILRMLVSEEIRKVIGRDHGFEIDPQMGFTQMGIDSLGAINLRTKLQSTFNRQFPATIVFDNPCLENLVVHLEDKYFADVISATGEPPKPVVNVAGNDNKSKESGLKEISAMPVAVIGMGCRFPDAKNPAEFWDLLMKGRDAIRDVPPERWDIERVYDKNLDAPGKMYVRRAAFVDEVDCFDAAFFGISPREAMYMDPRQRLLLEVTWEAIEAAGIDPSSLRGSDTGVYLGGDEFINDYLAEITVGTDLEPYTVTGNALSFSAGRLSYKLGLHGPSMTIATACSSSLVALHSAVQAIRQNECMTAIVGGAKLMLRPEETIQLCKLKALAPDGRSKAFSAEADGYGRGEGCGIVVLKRLDQALADKNPVLAVIRGSAVNHDGPSSGLTVPNGQSQSRLIVKAMENAGVKPHEVTYVEAHGTGTQLGDPIEINALNEVFAEQRTGPLFVGSVKANIGHLEEAAGIAGLMKVVLSLQHEQLPPQIHADSLNQNIAWDEVAVKVSRDFLNLEQHNPVIAGLSSFGMSGTNAHIILETAPRISEDHHYDHNRYIFVFSARDKEDLQAQIKQFIVFSDSNGHHPCDIAYTLHIGRKHERFRLAVVAQDVAALKDILKDYLKGVNDLLSVYEGALNQGHETHDPLAKDTAATVMESFIAREDWSGIAKLWCSGFFIDWAYMYKGANPHLVPLPTYPFKRKKVWIEKTAQPVLNPPGQETLSSSSHGAVSPQVLSDETSEIMEILRKCMADLLGMAPEEIGEEDSFYELGADSLTFIRASQRIKDELQVFTSFQQLFEEAINLQKLTELITIQKIGKVAAQNETFPAPEMTVQKKTPTFSASKVIQSDEQLNEQQIKFLDEFVREYSSRTESSKSTAQEDRSSMANCRMAPFRSHIKEVSYPIVAERSSGSRIWDVDGNEYIDISMGYGVHLFGHQPDFIVSAMKEQLDLGMQIGPLSHRAGKVANLLCELTGTSRIAFCNSGTEAVMAALRFARAATNRTKFVMFEGSYHGWSDGTLGLPSGIKSSLPMARGIGHGSMEDVVVLEYGTQESLQIIESLGHELAAVLVEPVQSRRPDLRPKEFLKKLRKFTADNDIALIFDEVITGFRVHPGGAQVWYGIDADIITYGKILGGGMPIGAVAGHSRFLDTVDGGSWSYGDTSSPVVPTTFYGGTFNKNPMSMAAAESVLSYIKAQGPDLQIELNVRVAKMADELNAYFEKESIPLQIVYFSSWFRFISKGEYSLQRFPLDVELFFYMMVCKGIYILETRVSFLSTSHTDEDIAFIIQTTKECVQALRSNGFFARKELIASVGGGGLDEEIYLDPAIQASAVYVPCTCENALLTGATGFLGAYLLKELLLATSAQIYCLVRADDQGSAMKRIKDNLLKWGCWNESFASRIEAIPGDLSFPRLGLSEKMWKQLVQQIDTIYHNGAHVNSLLPYRKLKAANVEGTKELLKLATEHKLKAFHYVSSDAVFESYGYNSQDIIYENQPLMHEDTIFGGGYSESKWVAEKLVSIARERGLPVSIYRPGMVTGNTSDGIGQDDDFFASFLRGIIQMQICPEVDAVMDFAPVDYVAQKIVSLSQQLDIGGTFHLTHERPITYTQFIQTICDVGFEVKIVPYDEWYQALTRLHFEDNNPLYTMMPLFNKTYEPIFRKPKLDVSNILSALPAPNQSYPDIYILISLYLSRYTELGIIKKKAA